MQVQIFPTKVTVGDETFEAKLPKLGTKDSAGVDISTPYKFTLKPGETHFVNTGLIVKAPRGFCILILPRSGLASKHGITVANSPGLIDRDYCGPEDIIKVALVNNGSKEKVFEAGDRVAQMMFVPYVSPDWDIQTSPDFASKMSRGGFGSTGVS